MADKKSKICVLGSGSWGTALAHHLRLAGHSVTIWGREREVLKSIVEEAHNPVYLPNHTLAPGIKAVAAMEEGVADAELIVISVPSSGVRGVAETIAQKIPKGAFVVNTAKGLEDDSFKSMSQVLNESLPKETQVAVLSGPSFAVEVVRGLPTAVVVAAKEERVAKEVAGFFHHGSLRIYTSTDVSGVEFGGVIKNVIAVAAGVTDGMEMGANARAALITRGLNEMQKLIVALGGERYTVMGLSGIGDLILTATSDLSRNRQVGLRLGRGEKLENIVASLGQVAEAIKTTHKVLELARRLNVDVPIIEEVDQILRGKDVRDSVEALLTRPVRAE